MNSWAQGQGLPGMGYIFWREGEGGRWKARGLWPRTSAPNGPRRSVASCTCTRATPCSSWPASRRNSRASRAARATRSGASWASSTRAASPSPGSSISRCTRRTRRRGASISPTTRFPCRRAGSTRFGRSARRAGLPVRPRLQRLRDRLGRHPEPQARDHVQGLRTGGLWRGGGAQALRRHGQRLPATARRPMAAARRGSTGS
jgi:hypothetical protein